MCFLGFFVLLLLSYINDGAIVQFNQYYSTSADDHYVAVDPLTVPSGFVFHSKIGYISNIKTNNNHRLCQKYNEHDHKIGRWTAISYNCQYYLDYRETTTELFYAWSTLNGCLNDMPSGFSCTKLLEYRKRKPGASNQLVWEYMYVTDISNIEIGYTSDNDIGDVYIGINTGPSLPPSTSPNINPNTGKSKDSDKNIALTVVLPGAIAVVVIIMLVVIVVLCIWNKQQNSVSNNDAERQKFETAKSTSRI